MLKLALSMLLVLTACSAAPRINGHAFEQSQEFMHSWIGRSEKDLIRVVGDPTYSRGDDFGNGRTLEYRFDYQGFPPNANEGHSWRDHYVLYEFNVTPEGEIKGWQIKVMYGQDLSGVKDIYTADSVYVSK